MCFILLAYPLKTWGDTLTFEDVLKQAEEHSFDRKIAEKDIAISKTDVKISRAGYLPTIQGRINSEYLRDLQPDGRPVTAIGDSIIPAGTRFQTSAGLNLNQKLFDFGIQKRRMLYARIDVSSKEASADNVDQDLATRLVDVYARGLNAQASIHTFNDILELAQQGYSLKKRLHEAGEISKIDLSEQAILVAQTREDRDQFKTNWLNVLKDLDFYTRSQFDPDTTELIDFEKSVADLTVSFIPEDVPEVRSLNAQIQMKEKEVEILQRRNLPEISLYSRYNLYGFDPDNYASAVGNLSQRILSVGVSVSVPVFDGFQNHYSVKKAKLERERLTLQRDKEFALAVNELERLKGTVNRQSENEQSKQLTQAEVDNRIGMIDRLSEQQMIDQTRVIEEYVKQLREKLDLERAIIDKQAAIYKFKALTHTLN